MWGILHYIKMRIIKLKVEKIDAYWLEDVSLQKWFSTFTGPWAKY